MKKRLTEGQLRGLFRMISKGGSASAYAMRTVGCRGASRASLVRRGLATVACNGYEFVYEITDAGRAAVAPPDWVKPGALADYHSIISGPVTEPMMVVRTEPMVMGDHWVTWLVGKAGCVAVDALSPSKAEV